MKKLIAIIILIAMLAMVGACFTGCGEEDNVFETAEWRYKLQKDTVTVSTQAEVDEYVTKGYTVVESGKKTKLEREYYSLVAYLGTDSDVVVPATVDGHVIEALESGLFLHTNDGTESKKMLDVYDVNPYLRSVVFLCDVKEIPDMCFYLCEHLTSVTFPANVTRIGDFSFYGCKELTSISFPSTVTSIGEYAFRECSALTTVTINNSAQDKYPPYIGAKCFYLLNDKAKDDDQYYIIPDLKIYVANSAVFEADYIKAEFKNNKNNDYRNWLDYVGDNGFVVPIAA